MAPALTLAERMQSVRTLLDVAKMPGNGVSCVTLPADDVRAALAEIELLQTIHRCAIDGATSAEAALGSVLSSLDDTVALFPKKALTEVLERYGAMRLEMEQMQRAVQRAAAAPHRIHPSDTVRARLTEAGAALFLKAPRQPGIRMDAGDGRVIVGQLWQVMAVLGGVAAWNADLLDGDMEVVRATAAP